MLTQQQRFAGLSPDMAQRAVAIAQALEQGRIDEAERGVIAALALAPKHPEILRLLGTIQLARRRSDEAIDTLVQSLKGRPQDALTLHTLAGAYEAQMDLRNALAAARRACEMGPELVVCWFNFGRLLFVNGHLDQAITILKHTVALAPQHVHARTMLASVLNIDGRPQEAVAHYRDILAQNPANGQAWWGLATLKPMRLDAMDIAQMRKALQRTDPGENDRISIGYALAHALEHAGDYAQAFATLQEANARARRLHPWNGDEFTARVESVHQAFAGTYANAGNDQGQEVIFIASLPRSGSTLTEQILASHSQVEGTAELPDVLQVIMDESDRVRQPFPQWVATHTAEQWRALGQRYLERTARWRKERPRFTDKMPGNWLYTGAILAMLPRARIVVARRDPLETCLGCYRYQFTRQDFTHDFRSLAEMWREFDRLCKFWVERCPDRVREQVYEELQADPEAQIRELLAFCDLPFEQACLNFHATKRRVTTPSASQVRQPMRRDTARATKYGALLDPLRTALGLPPFQPQ
jgi:tetratricopeptide (TPR) repeat protein